MPPKANAFRYLLKEARKAGVTLSNAFVEHPLSKRKPKRYVKGVHKGRFVRKRITPKDNASSSSSPTVPKLPPLGPQTMPQPLKPPPPMQPPSSSHAQGAGSAANVVKGGGSGGGNKSSTTSTTAARPYLPRMYNWWKQNAAVLVLNFGSLCTLTGFTRSDVLELRAFSMTGSLSSVVYFLLTKPIRVAPIAWSAIFAAVNGVKIYAILYERNAKVILTQEDEDIFVEHFMPSGVTPKQFELVKRKACLQQYKQGDVIVKQGDPLTNIYLVVSGKTRAHYMGRRLTAISSAPGHRENKIGGDAGAWIGEMTFLEQYGRAASRADSTTTTTTTSAAAAAATTTANGKPAPSVLTGRAIYTIVAASDCQVLVWSHKDVEELLQSSTDLRASMTRAMTAPIVGKVINFTVSMGNNNRRGPWAEWLEDWKNSGENTRVQVKQVADDGNADEEVEPVM